MRKKILLVDDSKTVLLMEKMVLHKAPYEVVTASNGEEALARALEDRPDIILMDVVMPKMSGFEACRRLREEAATREVPVIMVTTRGEVENVEMGYRCGCNDYITKPIDIKELLIKLRHHLPN
jgi:DNA-binding response OmpR family regulator